MLDLFREFDFRLLSGSDFKEDSVREEIVVPILKKLGYRAGGKNRIIRSKMLSHPFVYVGSKKRKISIFPDYTLLANDKPAWVLDAKAPTENIDGGKNVEQAYSYAIHPEVRVQHFALCNGHQFTLFHVEEKGPILSFTVQKLDDNSWAELVAILSPQHHDKRGELAAVHDPVGQDFDYMKRLSLQELPVRKRAARRHFGVHGYFTKQSWNVVQAYIQNFTKPGDVVVDPYGGSGITAIEAVMCGRHGIHIDINPLSCFWVAALSVPINLGDLSQSAEKVLAKFAKARPKSKMAIAKVLKKFPLPKNLLLPVGSDVERLHNIFTPKTMAELALLKSLIKAEKPLIRKGLMLAFSSTLTKTNLTYHVSDTGGGDAGIFRYYRYRMAPRHTYEDVSETFARKIGAVINAKREIQSQARDEFLSSFRSIKGDACDLSQVASGSVDYIYTDPPYGAKINYLDLSVMWNAWLDLPVTLADFKREVIEGGSQKKNRSDYQRLITRSLAEMFRVLKWNRWMGFVFQHQDPYYWHLIVDMAEKAGFEYVSAVRQNNGQTSFKKRQHKFTVLSGQMIINFRKVNNPQSQIKFALGMDVADAVFNNIEAVIAQKDGATLEEVYDQLIIHGLEWGFLDTLSKEYSDLTPMLNEHFAYDKDTQKYHLRENTKFKSQIPQEARIRYFLISYLKRAERQNHYPDFDDIVFQIMPLLQNGKTPEDQTIRNVLQGIGQELGGGWRLRPDNQHKLFRVY